MRRIVSTTTIIGVALCAIPTAAVAGRHDPSVHPKASASTTASAARVFLNIREAKRETRSRIKEIEADGGATPTYINVYACRRHSRVRVHCRFFDKGTFVDPQTQQTLGYKCTGKMRVRETADAYFTRPTGVGCFAYSLG